ncbi:MAG: DNA (cytosine-5-)-methyltransferase [Gammaproteobacteria bacterium]|nr:MAG: DNA (cytosine-5-)-methyltransferase [Gammaproteobacteria bacterium]
MSDINVLDLFCGTGGFSYGFQRYSKRFKIVGAIDLLSHATDTTKANHPNCVTFTQDIRTLKPSELERSLKGKQIDLIVGGPPCQGFSSLRPFRSSKEDDPRNSLFEQFALFVNYFKPKVFVMENVVGLVTHNKGKTLTVIEDCFRQMGYKFDWRILNTANYGVPQKRERFILIGTRDGGKISFPTPTHSFKGKSIGVKQKERHVLAGTNLPPAVTLDEAIGDLPFIESSMASSEYGEMPLNEYQQEMRKNSNILTMHEAANHSKKMLEIISYSGSNINCIPKNLITSGFSSCYSRLNPNEPATTLTVKFQSPASSKCIHPFQDRALTAREGARIQSFNDTYKFNGSKTNIISMLGNAVPPLLGKAIASSVIEHFEEVMLEEQA